MIILKWIPKQAGCYKLNQLLLAFLWVFFLKASWLWPFSPISPIFLLGFLAGWPARHKEEEEEEETGGRFAGPSCPRSRGALLRLAACWHGWGSFASSIGRWNWSDFMSLVLWFLHPYFEYFFSTILFQVALQLNVEQHQTVVAELQQQHKFLAAVPCWGWGCFKSRELLQ